MSNQEFQERLLQLEHLILNDNDTFKGHRTKKDREDALSAFLWTLYSSAGATRSHESLTTTETWSKITSVYCLHSTQEEMLGPSPNEQPLPMKGSAISFDTAV